MKTNAKCKELGENESDSSDLMRSACERKVYLLGRLASSSATSVEREKRKNNEQGSRKASEDREKHTRTRTHTREILTPRES